MREVRLKFSKTGQAKYISHMDTNRVFSRAYSRAKINLWYTDGFKRTPYISFTLPLSLGVESLCENVDIRITDDMSDDELKKRMNDALPVGIRILDVYENYMDCEQICYSDYVYKFEFEDNDLALQKIKSVLEADQIMALKKGKQGRKRVFKETDIKQFIVKYNISIRDEDIVLIIRLFAGVKKNLNHTLLFDKIFRQIDMHYEWKSIARINLLTEDLKQYR